MYFQFVVIFSLVNYVQLDMTNAEENKTSRENDTVAKTLSDSQDLIKTVMGQLYQPKIDVDILRKSIEDSKLTNKEIEELEIAFKKHTTQDNDNITAEQFLTVINSQGVTWTLDECKNYFKAYNIENETINYEQFIGMIKRLHKIYLTPLEAMTVEDIEWLNIFKIYDLDRDGEISAKEMYTVLNSNNRSCKMECITSLIDLHDFDKNGSLNIEEFRYFNMIKGNAKDHYKQMFNIIDEDKNGLISKNELSRFLTLHHFGMSQDAIVNLTRWTDEDDDGQINMNEFFNYNNIKDTTEEH
ncbi:calcium-binding protein LPS1-alpha-like [Adelges cooleyi]|uniref:calcium-binding protein LPS1-alpha-like n=1 Tax=Adelges cooleyi TaxID=133065 RepID=UPI00217FB5C1|nr:calcium-binding protein LPS1-alpha-like [Adelges cooleyi]